MKNILITIVVPFAACVFLSDGVQAQDAAEVTVLTPDSLEFRPHPAEKDGQIATLYGNPGEAGHFVIRVKYAPGWAGRPHTHGVTELLVVRSGTCYVALGDDLSREAATELPAGSFAAVPAGTPMRGFASDEPCVVDVQGQGPFTSHYLDEHE